MEINITNFENVLKKCTMNYHFDFSQLVFSGNKIRTYLIDVRRDVVIKHTLKNNVLRNIHPRKQYKLNFYDLHKVLSTIKAMKNVDKSISSVTPYDAWHNLKIHDNKISIKFHHPVNNSISYYDLNMCDEVLLGNTIMKRNLRQVDYFTALPAKYLDYLLIQKPLGKLFGKMYFEVNNKNLSILIGDKTDNHSNYWKHRLTGVNCTNMFVCFDYKNIENLLKTVKKNYDDYRIRLFYHKDDERGLLYCHSVDNKEKYFLFSRAN